jgi:hypothetical protein
MSDSECIHVKNIDNKAIVISDIEKYNIQLLSGKLILTLKKLYLTDKDISHYDLRRSEIIECKFNKQVITSPSYIKLLKMIWKQMPINKIIQNTIFNIKLNIDNIEGESSNYTWVDDLNFAFQPKNTNKTLKEIINMCKLNNFTIQLNIKLENDNCIELIV